jgi:hypothetical protein
MPILDFRFWILDLGKNQKGEIKERGPSCGENRLIPLPIQNLKSKI